MPISTESSGPRLMCHEPWADACLAAGNASVTRAERARTAEGAGKRIQRFDPRRRAGVTPRELGSLHLHWHGAVGCRPIPELATPIAAPAIRAARVGDATYVRGADAAHLDESQSALHEDGSRTRGRGASSER